MRLTQTDIRQFLQEDSPFRGSSESVLTKLSSMSSQHAVPNRSSFFYDGQPCEALHFIARGYGALVKTAPDGRRRILHRAGHGDMLGCVPFFEGKRYPASFVAESDCVLLGFPRTDMLRLFDRDPSVAMAIMGALAERMRLMVDKVSELSFQDTTHRLWNLLQRESIPTSPGDFPRVIERLPTREHLANTIGTVREVVSRRLSQLVASGHAQIEGKQLTLLKQLDAE